jgi:4-hydroxy-tetrahydrodipicolinate synthase
MNSTNLWTALITPFNDNLSVDFESLKTLIKQQNDAKNGLLILGSTGEALNIDLSMKKEILEFAIKHNKDSPLMVGVGGHELTQTKEWVSYLEGLTIDCYLMVTPLYAKPGVRGQYHWFKELMDMSSKPIILYNVPSRTGKELEHETVKMLTSHKNFWGIKEASGSVSEFVKYRADAPKAKIFSGDDALMEDFARVGGNGLISVAANTWPKETNLYVEQCLNNTLKEKDLWVKASSSLFIASNPIPAKRLLQEKKIIKTNKLLPPLSHEDLNDITEIIHAHENITSWYQAQSKES